MATLKQIADAIKKVGVGKAVADGPENIVKSVPKVAAELGEDLNGAFVAQVYDAEPVAFPAWKVAATQKGVKDAREAGLRFERIAARSGLTVGEVRDLAEKAGVGADFYVGRGRRQNGNGGGSAKPKATSTSGRRGKKAETETKQATSGRRGRGASAAAKAEPKARGRRGTRAAANPS